MLRRLVIRFYCLLCFVLPLDFRHRWSLVAQGQICCRSGFLVEHDRFGKPVPTFPDHALKSIFARPRPTMTMSSPCFRPIRRSPRAGNCNGQRPFLPKSSHPYRTREHPALWHWSQPRRSTQGALRIGYSLSPPPFHRCAAELVVFRVPLRFARTINKLDDVHLVTQPSS